MKGLPRPRAAANPAAREGYDAGTHPAHMTRSVALLALAAALAACGADADPAGAASGTPAVQTSDAAPDPSAANPGMSPDSLLTSRERLREARERYRRIADAGGWPSIPAGDLVEPGDTAAAQVQALRDRLAATDELGGAGAAGDVYDDRLAGALAAFQARQGLVTDSLLGGNTRQALNVSASDRVAQIEATLDRWDELPDFPTDGRYVIVNVPEFRVRGFEGNREAVQMKVVVGEAYDDRATPLFHDEMERVVFRPYWNVPPSIATEELVEKGPAELEEEGFQIVPSYSADAEVYDMTAANLRRVANGSLRIRQEAGPDNALGLVKFLFPNQYAVYLHDTPADNLFDRAERTFSHGCIRLEEPAAFGAWVLSSQGWDEARVREAMTTGERQVVELDQTIPVYIVYLPVWADESGTVHFSEDVYDVIEEA